MESRIVANSRMTSERRLNSETKAVRALVRDCVYVISLCVRVSVTLADSTQNVHGKRKSLCGAKGDHEANPFAERRASSFRSSWHTAHRSTGSLREPPFESLPSR